MPSSFEFAILNFCTYLTVNPVSHVMHLRHLHIPNLITYRTSLSLQTAILAEHFAARSKSTFPSPTLLTFQSEPTYTVGRRHLTNNPLSQAQIEFLISDGRAEFFTAPRGGLLTYHAPGQCTGYLIADLRRHGLTPRCYVRMLEESVMRTCGELGVRTCTTEDPGVWIEDQGATTRKVCAIGVQVSRGIGTHGVGLNVVDRGDLSWGFQRIVACGLEGKSVTWLEAEGAKTTVDEVAGVLAREMARGLKVDEVRKITREEAEKTLEL